MKHIKKIDYVYLRNNKNIIGNAFSECMIELTDKCNFNCVHCYNDIIHKEMSFNSFVKAIDFLKKVGVIYVTLTGGEPLVRSDFYDIYMYLKVNGFVVSIFTNGTLISKYYKLIEQYPPRYCSISLYGINEKMYSEFTGISGAFSKVCKSLNVLSELNIKFVLKCVITKLNYESVINGEFDEFANKYMARIKYNYEIFDSETGNKDNKWLQINNDEIMQFVFMKRNNSLIIKYMENRTDGKRNETCYAGRTGLVINSECKCCLCIRDSKNGIDLEDSIENVKKYIYSRRSEIDNINNLRRCNRCDLYNVCSGYCYLEGRKPDDKICTLHNKIKNIVR